MASGRNSALPLLLDAFLLLLMQLWLSFAFLLCCSAVLSLFAVVRQGKRRWVGCGTPAREREREKMPVIMVPLALDSALDCIKARKRHQKGAEFGAALTAARLPQPAWPGWWVMGIRVQKLGWLSACLLYTSPSPRD